MPKFLLNILVQISKALVNSKIQFLIHKFFSSLSARPTLRPTRSLAQPAPLASLLSRTEFNLVGPASPRVDGVFVEVHFPFWFAPFELAASLLSLYHVGPGCQFHLPPPPADRCHFLSSPLVTPRHPASNLEMPGEVFTPRLDSPLNFTP
jgi:hypothetical protein